MNDRFPNFSIAIPFWYGACLYARMFEHKQIP